MFLFFRFILGHIPHKVPAVWMLLTRQYQGFGSPDKGFAAAYCRSIVPKARDQVRQNVAEVRIPLAR
jgi:hypothetical protein